MPPKKKAKPNIQVKMLDLDLVELAVRMAENAAGADRPKGLTPEEAIGELDKRAQVIWLQAAHTAAEYFLEQLRGDGRPN